MNERENELDFNGQKVLPAIKKMADFELALNSDCEYIVMLELHLQQLQPILKLARNHKKKLLLHVDLIKGLKGDRYTAEFLCQAYKPDGLISTRGEVLRTAKKNNILAIQRLFLLDTMSLDTSYKMIESIKPDFIEVMPGIIPHFIEKINKETKTPIISSGLIQKGKEIEDVLQAGAVAVSTSHKNLWRY